MTQETGNMWSAHPANGGNADLFCITTNSFIRNDGSLVMGAGIARQARDKMPGLPQNAGEEIKKVCGHLGAYGLLPPTYKESCLALFQVKRHWKNDADTQLIASSAEALSKWLIGRPEEEVHVNYPGIGNGGLDRGDVAPIITSWPDNVHVWTYR